MKKKLLLLVAALLAIGQNAFAYDFSAVAPSGQTLYYKIIDSVNHYVKVTYPNDNQFPESGTFYYFNSVQDRWGTTTLPAGSLIIPDSVLYNGVYYAVTTIGGQAFAEIPYLIEVIMPNTIDSIGISAFKACDHLQSVGFSNRLRFINHGAFMQCNLGELTMPASLRVIGEEAFSSNHITNITLNDSIQILSSQCFASNNLTSLYIPASVTSIGDGGGGGWRQGIATYNPYLTTIIVDPSNPYYNSNGNCNAIIKNTGEVIQGCNSTVIPEGTIATSPQWMEGSAFAGYEFDSLSIPSSVVYIKLWGSHVGNLRIKPHDYFIINFSGSEIDTIIISSTTPPTISIENPNYNIPIIVPCNTLAAYQTSEFWSQFINIREYGAPQITVNAEHGTATVLTYPTCTSDTATVSATADSNYHFVSWSDGSTQNPYTLVLNGNTILSAIFAIDSVLVRATSANPLKGAVMGGGVVPLNGTTTLTAIPSGNSIFLTWSNGVTDNPYTLTATSDTSLQAYFTLPDTLIFRDTINHYIHDTTFINNYVHDTTIQYVNQYIHDTTYINNYVHDTTILYMNQYVHDTTYINNYIHDTVRMTTQMFDTTIVNVYHFDTAIYNTYHFDTLIVNNHYYDTVYITTHHYDTIYITEQGIGDVDGINAKVYSSNGQVVVEGANGNMVTLYDVTGRVLAAKQDDYTPMRFDAPVSGTYMIKIGAYPARKVVVIR